MEQYINKDAIVAELLRRRNLIPSDEKDKRFRAIYGAETFVLTELLDYVESLPVVNIEKELLEYESFVKFVIDNLIADSFEAIEKAKNIPMDDKVRVVKKAFEEALKEKYETDR